MADDIKWKMLFTEGAKQQSAAKMVEALALQETPHAHTAPARVKQQALKIIGAIHQDSMEDLYHCASDLVGSDNPTAEEIGAVLLADCYSHHPDSVSAKLQHVANSSNWEVREWVASAAGLILEKHFAAFYPTLQEWTQSPKENVRRAVVLAAMYAGRCRNPEFVSPLLDLIEPLLADESKYVRDNLGPFAIGSALIAYYPEAVLKRAGAWVQSENEQIRWNVAMIFSAAKGSKFARDAEPILSTLMQDNRPYVKKALAKALRRIAKSDADFAQRLESSWSVN